jgi:alcohol dehydrogenase class IV
LANALCLVAVLRFNAPRKPGLYRRVGLACGLDLVKCADAEADRQTIDFIAGFLAGLGLNRKLRELGVQESQIPALTAQAFEDPCHQTNAVPVTAEDLKQLYQSVF